MATYREANSPVDQETAPLLRETDNDENGSVNQAEANGGPKKTFTDHLTALSNEPLTPLTRVLLVVTLVLLLLTSIFIGLFAGAEHKLGSIRGGEDGDGKEGDAITTTITTTVHATETLPPPGPVPTRVPERNPCITPQCIILAASILEGLDTTKDPCENFYDYANGGWISKNEIPAGRGRFAQFDKLAQDNKRIIHAILEPDADVHASEDTLVDYDQQTLTKLRNLYKSCVNEDLLNTRGDDPLLEFITVLRRLIRRESTKVTPDSTQVPLGPGKVVLETAEAEGGQLTNALAYLHSRGIDALFSFDIDGDVGNDPNAMSLWFSQPGLGLPSKEYYDEEEIVDLYTAIIESILHTLDDSEKDEAKLIEPCRKDMTVEECENSMMWPPWPWPPWGDDDDNDKDKDHGKNKTKVAEDVVQFERKIANISLDLEDLYGDPFGTYNPTPFHQFASSLPQVDFPTYLSTFAPRSFPTSVIVTSTAFLANLSSVLSTTSNRTLEAYLVTRAALTLAPYLGSGSEVWRAHRSLVERLQGIKKGQVPDRSEWCVQEVEGAMGFASGRFFVKEAFGGDSQERGVKVIYDIIDAFKESLKNLSWMDEESATAAAEKADAIRVKVGFPLSPDTNSAASIARYYSLVKINETTFFENILNASVSDEVKKWLRLGKQRDVETWEMFPSTVNAYFNPPANEIVFPAGILRPPFFSVDWPSYLLYGAFGHVAAHELTHAFDSSGRLYNQHGKLEQWWTNKTSKGFNERQKCIAEQYSKYTVDDGKGGKVHVNGNLTSGENIGDTGLVQAYRAWRGQYHTSLAAGKEYLLPGLNYTQEELFFIANAQIWAQKIKPASAVQRVRTDPHSPNRYRVEGTVSNIPEFAAAFNCPAGAKLNPPPEKQCILW